ncbi:MAG: hypothetical protein LQ340_004637 [Diploschistes diacapsis]|nr:MAG: hypothetical protein LQ340_004637 [Diploschistes diacapsis]
MRTLTTTVLAIIRLTTSTASLAMYILGYYVFQSFILVFILTALLLASDFYYLKNIAGRRLVGLRWWNEVNIQTGDSTWVFESAEGRGQNGNKTDNRFFWIAVYAQPAWWVLIAIWSVFSLKIKWLSIVVIALVLTITNAIAFSRCDKFSQASNLASTAFYGTGFARNVAGSMFSRVFSRS